jgi:proteasome lid subunit RPN8/RPN11
VVISPALLTEMLEHLRSAFPAEGCGLLGGQDRTVLGVFPIRNADDSPVHYTLEPLEQLQVMEKLDERNWDLVAIFHSHTRTRPFPSATDIEMAQVAAGFYPDALYVIASLARWEHPEVRAFRIEGGEVTEVEIVTAEQPITP